MLQPTDPRLISSAADLSDRFGDDAIVIALGLASGVPDAEHRAFWSRVVQLLEGNDDLHSAADHGFRMQG